MKLVVWRTSKDMTQAEVANALGCHVVTVNRYENGSRIPSRSQMRKIIALTKGSVTPNDFVDTAPARPRARSGETVSHPSNG